MSVSLSAFPCVFQAAGGRGLIETSPRMGGNFAFGGTLPDGTHSLLTDWHTDTPPIYRYSFGPAVFDPALALFAWEGHPLHDTVYTQGLAALERWHAAPTSTPVEQHHCTAWAGFDHWNTNYYHWVAHTVPALYYFLKHAGQNDVFLLPPLTPWQEQFVTLAGLAPERRLITHPGTRYAFPRVVYTDFVRGKTDFTASATSLAAYAALRQAASTTPTRGRYLFLERGEATNRHMPNEAELAEALTALGFTRVRPERLPIAQQIDLFAQADMVMGFLGAGLANVAWCQPGTLVYELVPSHHLNPCFLAMCIQGGLQYWADKVETGVAHEDHYTPATLPLPVGEIVSHTQALLHWRKGQIGSR